MHPHDQNHQKTVARRTAPRTWPAVFTTAALLAVFASVYDGFTSVARNSPDSMNQQLPSRSLEKVLGN